MEDINFSQKHLLDCINKVKLEDINRYARQIEQGNTDVENIIINVLEDVFIEEKLKNYNALVATLQLYKYVLLTAELYLWEDE